MKFTTEADVNGTSLQGYMQAYYHQLVVVFGEPEGGGDKTTVEWCLSFEDGTVATIYDWKEYDTPTGLYRWHIGGRSPKAVDRVKRAFKQGQQVIG
jgi:hypothetical protein